MRATVFAFAAFSLVSCGKQAAETGAAASTLSASVVTSAALGAAIVSLMAHPITFSQEHVAYGPEILDLDGAIDLKIDGVTIPNLAGMLNAVASKYRGQKLTIARDQYHFDNRQLRTVEQVRELVATNLKMLSSGRSAVLSLDDPLPDLTPDEQAGLHRNYDAPSTVTSGTCQNWLNSFNANCSFGQQYTAETANGGHASQGDRDAAHIAVPANGLIRYNYERSGCATGSSVSGWQPVVLSCPNAPMFNGQVSI